MEISDLRVFRQVALSGGITRAAEALNRVPSNVTARIKKLEDELGKALFIRESKGLRISVAGEQLLDYAERILDLAQEAITELQQIQPTGSLSVGAMEAVAATRLVQPTMKFHQAHPNIDLTIKAATTGELIEKVLNGKLDLAFVADPSAHEELQITPIIQETLVLISDLKQETIRKPEDLQEMSTVLGFSARCAYRNRLTSWLNQGHINCKVVEISSYHTLLSCVAAGMGVGIVPQALLDHYPFREHIKVHPLPPKWRKSVTSIIWRKASINANIESYSRCVLENI